MPSAGNSSGEKRKNKVTVGTSDNTTKVYSDWLVAKLMSILFCIFQEVRILVGKAFRQTEAILDANLGKLNAVSLLHLRSVKAASEH